MGSKKCIPTQRASSSSITFYGSNVEEGIAYREGLGYVSKVGFKYHGAEPPEAIAPGPGLILLLPPQDRALL